MVDIRNGGRAGFFFMAGPLPQDEAFHRFADGRTVPGIENFWNVASNLPFAIKGILGLHRFRGVTDRILFSGIFMTALGSGWYHLAPDDTRLVWDRLPMTIVFTSFVVAVVSSNLGTKHNTYLLAAPLIAGAGSVVWWALTNDLRPYAVVKFGPILDLAPMLFRSEHRGYLLAIVGLFGLAQAFKLADKAMALAFMISGHTLKHLAAGWATGEIYAWRRSSQA